MYVWLRLRIVPARHKPHPLAAHEYGRRSQSNQELVGAFGRIFFRRDLSFYDHDTVRTVASSLSPPTEGHPLHARVRAPRLPRRASSHSKSIAMQNCRRHSQATSTPCRRRCPPQLLHGHVSRASRASIAIVAARQFRHGGCRYLRDIASAAGLNRRRASSATRFLSRVALASGAPRPDFIGVSSPRPASLVHQTPRRELKPRTDASAHRIRNCINPESYGRLLDRTRRPPVRITAGAFHPGRHSSTPTESYCGPRAHRAGSPYGKPALPAYASVGVFTTRTVDALPSQ